ncbi:hypothetical protein AAG906_030941 [Vitis piasezkii]
MSWDGYDDLPVAALPTEFRMLNIERYKRIGCPRIHLQLYNAIMRGHRLDEALYGIEDGIAKGLWAYSSPSDSKGKKLGSGFRPSDIGTIGMATQRPPMQFHHQCRASPPPRSIRQFSQLGMPLSRAFQRSSLCLPPEDNHDTDSCAALRHIVRAYDGTQRTIMGIITAHVMIGPIQSSFNLFLGRPWIHEAGAIPSSLHQKVKFIHEGRVISSDRDVITSVEPVLQISHSDDDLHLTGFTFDEQGPHDFAFTVSHDAPYGLGYTPIEEDACRMASRITEASDVVIVAPSSPGRANMFSMCFPDEDFDFGLLMDMIGIGRILDATPHRPHYAFDLFGVSMLEMDGDDSITDVATPSFISERASAPVDPPISFDFTSGFVTRYDVMSDGNNNDMNLFEYLPMSQHFLLIAPQAPTAPIHDIDDVGDPNDPLSGKSDCDSDSEKKKVTPIFGSVESVDFGTSDQPRELKIDSSLSLDEMSRLINLLRSYLDVFAWSYEDMPGLDPSIVQHHLPTLPHAKLVKQKLRRLHPRWILQVKEEIQKQLSVGFLSMVEYPQWMANVVPVPKKDDKIRVCVDYRDLNKAQMNDPRATMLYSFDSWFPIGVSADSCPAGAP